MIILFNLLFCTYRNLFLLFLNIIKTTQCIPLLRVTLLIILSPILLPTFYKKQAIHKPTICDTLIQKS